ncbi:MAG: HD domain-containing protein [Mailhella sp.]|nr:HD domain-containing protein [Mailhella sp.]
MTTSTDLDEYERRFIAYTAEFDDVPDAAPLRLKVEHTFRVYDHAKRIVASLETLEAPHRQWVGDTAACRAAVLAALFHDCGRFPQFKHFRTFLDAASVNHAVLSFQTMRDRAFLQREGAEVRGLAHCAVLLHNRYSLSPKLNERARFVTEVVRDADKLDIFRIMVSYLTSALPEKDAVLLHVKDEPEKWSPTVVDDVLNDRIARYSDLRYINDFRLLLGTWMDELRFPVTRKALADSGLMDNVLEQLPDTPELRPALDVLRVKLAQCREAAGGKA